MLPMYTYRYYEYFNGGGDVYSVVRIHLMYVPSVIGLQAWQF